MKPVSNDLPRNHYRVRVNYKPEPFADLVRLFTGGVSREFDPRHAIEDRSVYSKEELSRMDLVTATNMGIEKNGPLSAEPIFRLPKLPPEFYGPEWRPGRPTCLGHVLEGIRAKFDHDGYRAVSVIESIAFARDRPELLTDKKIIVLGATIMRDRDDNRGFGWHDDPREDGCVPYLSMCASGPALQLMSRSDSVTVEDRILLARK